MSIGLTASEKRLLLKGVLCRLIREGVEIAEFGAGALLADMHPDVGAGFYAAKRGVLPFGFGAVPQERYFIYSTDGISAEVISPF